MANPSVTPRFVPTLTEVVRLSDVPALSRDDAQWIEAQIVLRLTPKLQALLEMAPPSPTPALQELLQSTVGEVLGELGARSPASRNRATD